MKLLSRLSARWFLAGLIAVAAIPRLFFINYAAVWHDEGYTTSIIQHGFLDIIARSVRDVHPPLYYLALHAWQGMFGYNIFSIRGFSVVCGIATVIVVYLLMRKLFSESTARLAGFLVAIGPFFVRYSDEARMYAFVALLVTGATYALVTALEKKNRHRLTWWIVYALLVTAALYTQYYALFIVPVHLVYSWWKVGSLHTLVTNKYWWMAHLGFAALFLPWAPTILAQTSRVQKGFWIPPLTYETIPNTFAQFIIYEAKYPYIWEILLIGVAALLVAWTFWRQHSKRAEIALLVGWLIVPIIAVALLSMKQPVYHDRYFTYSSVAFYALLAVVGSQIRRIRYGVVIASFYCAAVIGTLLYGYTNVAAQLGHRMDVVGNYVTHHALNTDAVVSAELYTYFDFTFYNHSTVETKLLYETPVDGYGEMGLLYDRPDLIISDLHTIKAPRVWLVGKTGDHPYYTTDVPSNWRYIERVESGDSAVQLYEIR